MKELTKAEEQVMQVLWEIREGFVNDILEHLPEPKPAYNTISTIVRILVKKEFVGYKAFGKTHQYFPLVDKATYSRFFMNNFVGNYFGGSYKNLVSFFARDKNIDTKDLESLLNEAKQEKTKKGGLS